MAERWEGETFEKYNCTYEHEQKDIQSLKTNYFCVSTKYLVDTGIMKVILMLSTKMKMLSPFKKFILCDINILNVIFIHFK